MIPRLAILILIALALGAWTHGVSIPANALTDGTGNPLIDGAGNYLVSN